MLSVEHTPIVLPIFVVLQYVPMVAILKLVAEEIVNPNLFPLLFLRLFVEEKVLVCIPVKVVVLV